MISTEGKTKTSGSHTCIIIISKLYASFVFLLGGGGITTSFSE